MTDFLETPRLLLRQWRDADYAPFAALNADPAVMEFFPEPLERSASDALAHRCRALIEERGWGVWAVELKSEGHFIGSTGLHVPAADLPCSPCVEVGWRLARAAWGKGYATEAASAALRFGFTVVALPEIVAFTALGNVRSQAVMERLGMRRDQNTFQHPAVPEASQLREHCLYRITRQEWLAKAESGSGKPPYPPISSNS